MCMAVLPASVSAAEVSKSTPAGIRTERPRRNEHFFSETAIALHTEQLTPETKRFVAATAKFTFAAEKIGLHGHLITGLPVFNVGSKRHDATGHFAAGRARERDGNRESAFFQPEIEMIEAAGLHLHHHFIRCGLGFGQIAKFKCSRRAVGDELDRFHAGIQHPRERAGKAQ